MDEHSKMLIAQLEKFMDTRFDQMEKKIDEQEERTRLEIERFRADMENMFNVKMSINSNDHTELWQEVKTIKAEVREIKDAEAKKLIEAKNGFLKIGQELFTKSFWGIALLFVGFLIWDFIKNGGIK